MQHGSHCDVMTDRNDLAQRLLEVFRAAVGELVIRDDAGGVADEVAGLIEEPVALYAAHPVWPSLLTDSGLPVEISLRLGVRGPAVRCVADVTDHRSDNTHNWSRYVDHARRICAGGADTDSVVWDLCCRHLDGAPRTFRSRMVHGLGYGRAGWRRASLYFRVRWMDEHELGRRLPDELELLAKVARTYATPVDRRIEVVGYDLVPGRPVRAKAYSWCPVDPEADFVRLLGNHADLEPAREVFETFRPSLGTAQPYALLLQTSFEDEGVGVGQRLFFFASSWGWGPAPERDRLFALLSERIGLDLAHLSLLADVAAAQDITLKVALVAIGLEEGEPSATFYLWPEERRTSDRAVAALAGRMLDNGRRHLLANREPDGSWRDYDGNEPQTSDMFVTAYVTAALVAARTAEDDLARTLDWLASRDPAPWDAETLGLLTLASGRGEGAASLLAEVSAAGLPGVVGPSDARVEVVVTRILALARFQRSDGGWRSERWVEDLMATWRAVRALRAFTESRTAASEAGREAREASIAALTRVTELLLSRVVPPEPFQLAVWLGTCAAGGVGPTPPEARIRRATDALARLQEANGSWRGGPHRRTGSAAAAAWIDDRCLVTTATVCAALAEVARSPRPAPEAPPLPAA
jgi:hypothetical protein